MNPRVRRLLLQAGSFLLAGVLLYLALRPVDLAVVWRAITEAAYGWLVPLIAVVLASHLLRAWRWKVLLEALPSEPGASSASRVSLRASFYALMIGYMVNYAAPRLGEVVRSANLSRRSDRSFSAVFGTVVVERLLDLVMLALALSTLLVLLLDRRAAAERLFIDPLVGQFEQLPSALLAAIAVGFLALVAFLYWRAVRRTDGFLARLWQTRLRPLAASFRDGLLTLLRSDRPVTLGATSVAMWGCYLLMAHLPFVMLGMTDAFGLTLLDSWAIMLLGAIGMSIPSPGGVGSYHYITIQTLVHLYGVDADAAATYAVLSHAAQLLLHVAVGAACLVLQGSGLAAVRPPTAAGAPLREAAAEPEGPAPR